jgi:type I restriction enzyme S subunit
MSEPLAVREAPAKYQVVLDAQRVKPGFKQTEVGVIPVDWDVHQLGELLANAPSYGIGAPAIPFDSRYPTYLRITDISEDGRFIDESKASVKHPLATGYMLSEGDLVLARTGASVGKSYLYDQRDGELVFAGFLIRARPDTKKLEPRYLQYFTHSRPYWNWIKVNSMRSGQPGINGREYASLLIPLPPTKAEQEAIAEALSDADALTEALEQLIAKKRHLKQGAMQELLTGKKRLPGFSGEWEVKRWGDVIIHCSSGATPYRGRPDFYKGDIKWISSGELNYNVITDTLEHISKIAVEKTNLRLHPAGTFLMAITGLEAAGTRGACGIVGSPATTNQSCMAVYPTSELLTEYLYHYYVYRGDELALEYCQGTKQQSYTAQLIRILPIHLPPTVEEQSAIAIILSDMDTEIAALETRLAKTRELKQGMMHNLLTGKIRLV